MRSWLVIPAMGAASAAAAAGLGARPPEVLVALGLAGAAMAAAQRALAGDSPASLAGAALAPLLIVAALLDGAFASAVPVARGALAVAAAAWTLVELARPTTSPLVALLPATIAAFLSPAYVALLLVAGSRLVTAPWQRPRWAIAVPIAAALAVVVAAAACLATHGSLARLADAWSASPRAPIDAAVFAEHLVLAVGPIAAVAALCGLPALARWRHAEVSAAATALTSLAISIRAGAIDPSMIGVSALCAGLAVGRLAGTIRLPTGQAFAGATIALLVLAAPAWAVLSR